MADKREGKIVGEENESLLRSSPPPGSIPSVSLQTTPEDPDPPGSEGGSSRGSSERGTPVKYRRGSRLSDSFQDNASTCSSTSSVGGSASKTMNNSKFPVRPGISWKKGERVEAMDFMNKWYPAKIVDIEEDEQSVMIHFDGWNSRYDEWVPMTSEKLRPRVRYSSRKDKPRHGVFKLGEPVYAKWTDCKMYPGKITAMPTEGAYEVLFYDGFKKVVQGINIKPMPSEVRNQKIEIVHVLPKDEKKRSGETEVTGKRRSSSVYARRSVDEVESGDREMVETVGKIKAVQKRKSSGSRERKKKDGSKSATMSRVPSTETLITNVTESRGDEEMVEDVMSPSGIDPAYADPGVKQTLSYEEDEGAVSGSIQADLQEEKQEVPEEESKEIMESPSEQTDANTISVKTDLSTTIPASPASTLSAATTPPLTPKLSPVQRVESNTQISSNIPATVIPALTDRDRSTPVSRPHKKAKKEVISPSISESSVGSHTESAEALNRKRSKSSFEKSYPSAASSDFALSRKRSRSATTERSKGIGNYILVPETEPPPKAFVVEQEHNHYKCTFEGCNKGFRKESLLDYHLKYYHSNDGKPVQIPPPRKRRKTSSICSTDSDVPISAKQRSRSLSGNQSKQRHVSTESASSTVEVPPPIVEPPPSVSTVQVTDEHLDEESNRQRTISQNTMVTEDVMEMDAEDTLSKDEVVNCICGFYEENGLMIQCDVCLCWQHAACFEITEATLPKKYVCYVCDNPPGVRDSFKFIHEQDWLRNGQMAHFKFLHNQEVDESRCRTVQATHGLVSDVINMGAVLQSLKQKYKIARDKDKTNPELRNWIQNLDLVESDSDDDETDDDSATEEDIRSRHEEDMETETELSVTDNNTSGIENESTEKMSSLTESKDSGETEGSTAEEKDTTADKTAEDSNSQSNISHTEELSEKNSNLVNNSESVKDSESVNNMSSAGACPSNDSSEQKTEESSVTINDSIEENKKEDISLRDDDNSDTLSADSIRYESETGGDDSQGPYSVIGPSGDGQQGEGLGRQGRGTDNVSVVIENPFQHCERNLLEHILRIQNELEKRMDMIEEQVSALEAADSTFQAPSQSHNILSDVPQLKRSLYMLQNDLEKVKLMSTYHR